MGGQAARSPRCPGAVVGCGYGQALLLSQPVQCVATRDSFAARNDNGQAGGLSKPSPVSPGRSVPATTRSAHNKGIARLVPASAFQCGLAWAFRQTSTLQQCSCTRKLRDKLSFPSMPSLDRSDTAELPAQGAGTGHLPIRRWRFAIAAPGSDCRRPRRKRWTRCSLRGLAAGELPWAGASRFQWGTARRGSLLVGGRIRVRAGADILFSDREAAMTSHISPKQMHSFHFLEIAADGT